MAHTSYTISDKSHGAIYWKNIKNIKRYKKNINQVGWDTPFGMYIIQHNRNQLGYGYSGEYMTNWGENKY